MSPRRSDDAAGQTPDVHAGRGIRAWRAGLLAGVALTIIAIAAAVIVAGDFTGAMPQEAPPTDELPDESLDTTTASEEPEIVWPGLESSRCYWMRGLRLPADGVSLVAIRSECWPGIGTEELWWLAVSQTLAGAWDADDPERWQRRLLAICTSLDDAVSLEELARGETGSRILDDPAALAYSWHREIAPDLADESQDDWRLRKLEWAAAIAEDMATGAGRAWKYTALTATGLYCPEHRTHLRHHRDELLTLETTVRRCAASRDGFCLHLKDIAVTPDTRPVLEYHAEFEAELNARKG